MTTVNRIITIVPIFLNQSTVIYPFEHEYQHKGEHSTVADLGKEHDHDERGIRYQNDPGAQDDYNGEQPEKLGSLPEIFVNSGFPAHTFADVIRSGTR